MSRTISVVIPTYNSAHLLPEAIASVRAQNWPDIELIVVDDGSTDNSEDVLNALAQETGLRWFRQKNAGAASARNRGIAESRGEWVAFLDADDVWLPGKLALQFERLDQTDADFSFTDSRLRFENGREQELPCPVSSQPLLPQLLKGNLFGTPTVVVRRSCFDKVGMFDPELRTGEDWDMWLRLASCFRSLRVPLPLCLVRATVSRTKFSVEMLERCTLRVLERLFACKHVAEHWPEVAAQRRLIYAWHYSVLAKSYLQNGRPTKFGRLLCRAVTSHPAGLKYVMTGGNFGKRPETY